MIVLGLVAALFTIFIAGFGVTMSIVARDGRINLVECGCLGWLLGAGVVSLLLWVCGMFCSGFILQAVVTIACLALAILGWRTKKHSDSTFVLPRPANTTEWILASIVLIEIAVLLFVSFKHTLGWDGLLNWELKARYAFLNGGSIPSSYYSSAGRAFSHPEYPLGIPFTELWLYLWMGEPNQFWVKIIFPLFYAACAPLLALLVSRLSGKRWVGLLIATLLPFVPSISASPGGVVVGYVDVPLSVFYLAALGYLLCWFKTDDRQFVAVFAACSALLPWIKSEGIILWAILVVLGFILSLAKHRVPQFLVSTAPGLLLVLCWKIYLTVVHLWPHSDFVSPSFSWLRDNIGRLRDIFSILFEELSEPVHWSIFWFLAAVAIVYLFVSRKLEKVILAGAVVLPVILYSLIYLFSNWPSYTAHMTSSVPRLLLHVMPAGWLAIGLALSQAKSEKSNALNSFEVTPQDRTPAVVRAMFGSIARRYDLANHVLSCGCDFRWRKRAAEIVAEWNPAKVVDLAAGTGDLTLALEKVLLQSEIIAADFSEEMLAVAKMKGVQRVVTADALALPFVDRSFDCLTIAFGLRNIKDWNAALREMSRVLNDNGHLLVMEFSLPQPSIFRGVYRFYLHRLLPVLGSLLTGKKSAYDYLGESIEQFPGGEAMLRLIEANGFGNVAADLLMGGIVTIYTATKS